MTIDLLRIRRILYATTVAVFLLIAIGGFVRAAGAGLGCESWPKCFEWSWFPPTSVEDLPPHVDPATFSFTKAWIEYINRLIGVVIGFLVFFSFLAVRKCRAERPDLFWPVLIALITTGIEGWIGGMVVKQKLDPRLVSIHLFLALLIAMLLVYATMNTRIASPYRHRPETWSPERKRFHGFTWALLALVFMEEIVGALVRGTIEKDAQPRADLTRAEWIDVLPTWLDFTHRKLALITLVLVVVGIRWSKSLREPGIERVHTAAWVSGSIALFQIFAGITLAYFALPPAAQVIHVACGALLVGALQRQGILIRRLDTPSVL